MSYELRVTSLDILVTSSNPRVASLNLVKAGVEGIKPRIK